MWSQYSTTHNKLDLQFRNDVYRFLCDGKGRTPPNGQGLFYNMENLYKTCFKDKINVYDKLGDGFNVDFPISLESFKFGCYCKT